MEGHCNQCKDNRFIVGDTVACKSMKHAKFMDIFGTSHHQDAVSTYGFMSLKSAESVGLTCHDCK